ncbi:unnamed protein product [Urochloa humidicola]
MSFEYQMAGDAAEEILRQRDGRGRRSWRAEEEWPAVQACGETGASSGRGISLLGRRCSDFGGSKRGSAIRLREGGSGGDLGGTSVSVRMGATAIWAESERGGRDLVGAGWKRRKKGRRRFGGRRGGRGRRVFGS